VIESNLRPLSVERARPEAVDETADVCNRALD
jgi:hypothetical protein